MLYYIGMKKNDLLKYLKEIKIDSKMQAALMLLNSRRELDESNIALSFQHRDRIKRVVKEVGLDIDFVSNKLVLESPVGSFEIKNYSNKKKKIMRYLCDTLKIALHVLLR